MPSSDANVTRLLAAWNDGDRGALEALTPVIEAELHRLARGYMAGERPGHVLQPTALVNEAYLRLVDWKDVRWQNRAHFFAMAARTMRHVLVDMARTRDRAKRGGRQMQVSLSDAGELPVARSADFVALDDALTGLEKIDPRKSRVVELRYFCGLSVEETAAALTVSQETVYRDWRLAKAWLRKELRRGASDAP